MAISAKELAQKLNISAATVSMVLNHKPGISEATRQMVLNAAKEYGYQFKKAPEDPDTRTIQIVIYHKNGLILSDTPFFNHVIEGISFQCQSLGFTLHMSYFYERDSMEEQLEHLCELDVDGILLLGTEMAKEDFTPFTTLSMPLVVLDSYYEEIPFDSVVINNIQGAFAGTCHLAKLGHKKIGYLRSSFSIHNFEERAEGYYKALRVFGLDINHPYVCRICPVPDRGYEDMLRYLEEGPQLPTAYFADNDIVAGAAIRALKEKGFRVPEDVAVMGFDNIPFGSLMEPPLATMEVEKQQLGILAVDILNRRIQNPNGELVKVALGTKVIHRTSAG